MKKSFCATALLLSVFLFVATALGDPGSTAAQSAPQALKDLISDRMKTVEHWESQANLQVGLTISVIIFGALVTILQGSSRGWCKGATLALGAGVSIITGISTKVFPADYRALEKSAVQVRSVLRELTEILDRFDPQQTAENRLELRAEFMKKYAEIDQVEKQMFARNSIFKDVGVVYAAIVRKEPEWLTNVPSDPRSYFYVGVAEDSSLSKANQLSLEDGVHRAANALSPRVANSPAQQAGPASSALTDFIRKSAQVDGTYFSFDKEKNVYRYYTLVRLTRAIEGLDLSSLISATPFRLRLQSIQPVADGGRPLGAWRFECLVNGTTGAQIPEKKYDAKSRKPIVPNAYGGPTWSPATLPSSGTVELRVAAYSPTVKGRFETTTKFTIDESVVNQPVNMKVPVGPAGRGSFDFTFVVTH